MVYQCTLTGAMGRGKRPLNCLSHRHSQPVKLFILYTLYTYLHNMLLHQNQLNTRGLVMVHLINACIKNVLIKFCTNDKYLKEHIEKINYKYFHHTNGKRHHMVGSITTLWFSDDSTCDKNSLEPLFQVSKTNTLQ